MVQLSSAIEAAVEQIPEESIDPGVLEQEEIIEEVQAASIPYYREITVGGIVLSVLCLLATLAVISVPVSLTM